MGNKIDLSVIIPMYNSEHYIQKTIHSITSQDANGLNYEIIIVDDCSKDNSIEVVRNLNNERIKLVELKKNRGPGMARNAGLEIAKGEWVQFLDSDDSICNDLYRKFEMSLQPQINCYVFSLIREYESHSLVQNIIEVKDKRAFGHFGGVVWNKFIKKEICLDFMDGYVAEDFCFCVEMMNKKPLNIALIKDAYYLYNCKNEQSIMSSNKSKEALRVYRYIFKQIPKSDSLTKMFILETVVAVLFAKNIPIFLKLQLASKAVFKLLLYVPKVYLNGIRHSVINTIK